MRIAKTNNVETKNVKEKILEFTNAEVEKHGTKSEESILTNVYGSFLKKDLLNYLISFKNILILKI